MDKTRFTDHPQLDSEGFTMADARCHGCAPSEMCPRSGYCERTYSPLRYGAMPDPVDQYPQRAADGNSYRYHAAGLPAGGDRITLGSDPIRGIERCAERWHLPRAAPCVISTKPICW
jgi:hypothetical protein